MSRKLKTGLEYKRKDNGERVIVLRHIDLWDLVYYIDEVLFCNAISYPEFSEKFTATGRQNTAIKTIFKDKYFKEIKAYDKNKATIN